MDRFDAMRAFVQVVESGSYTKAALQLNLHKATVSQQIQQLEDKLGTRLLTRTTRSVTPTEEGMAYYEHACAILQQVDEVESQLRKGTSAPAGHLRIDVPVAMGRLVFAPRFADFSSATPRSRSSWGAPTGPSIWCRKGWTARCVAASCRTRGCRPAASAICALRCVLRRTTSSSTDCPAHPRTWPATIRSGMCSRRPARCDP